MKKITLKDVLEKHAARTGQILEDKDTPPEPVTMIEAIKELTEAIRELSEVIASQSTF